MAGKQTTIVVTGAQRSGTTMMMKALEAGGIETAYEREDLREMNRTKFQWSDLYGKAVKCAGNAIKRMPKDGRKYKVIVMRRDSQQIADSWNRFRNSNMKPEHADTLIENIYEHLNSRDDVTVVELWYQDVLEDPIKQLNKVKQKGIKIDSSQGAQVVEPETSKVVEQQEEANSADHSIQNAFVQSED